MDLSASIGLCSLLTPSPNLYGRYVAAALMCVGNTASVSINPFVDMVVSLLASPSRPQFSLLQPLICGMCPHTSTFSLTLLGSVPYSGCGMVGGVGPLLSQSA